MPIDPLHTPEYVPVGDEYATIVTNKGTVVVELDGLGAPVTVGNFCELAESGFYDGVKFHRYEPGFVIQGGDPITRDMDPSDVAAGIPGPAGVPGTGGPGWCIRHEYVVNPRNSHVDGAIAMARSAMPDSAGSQFYLCLGPQHFLDSGYTVFGVTEEGLDVAHSLRAGDVIESVTISHGNPAA